MNYGDYNFIEITQQTKLRVAPVALVVSSELSRAVRQARHNQNAWARHVERVDSCRVETWRAKWNLDCEWLWLIPTVIVIAHTLVLFLFISAYSKATKQGYLLIYIPSIRYRHD